MGKFFRALPICIVRMEYERFVANKKAFVKSVLPVGNIKSEEFKNSSLFIIDDKLKFTDYRLFLRLFNASALFDITIPTA